MKPDSKTIVLQFNDCISRGDLDGLAGLMADDIVFTDRENTIVRSKLSMIDAWSRFFKLCPGYRNTFELVRSEGDRVVMRGHAYWTEREPRDPAIWVATIEGGLIREWRILYDSPENRNKLGIEA